MKKLFYLMAVAFFSLGFISCGSDDDDDDNVSGFSTEEIRQGLVGRWICYEFNDENNELRKTTITEKLLNDP